MTVKNSIRLSPDYVPPTQRLCQRRREYIEEFYRDYKNPLRLLLAIKGNQHGPSGKTIFIKAIRLRMTHEEIEQACWTGIIRAAQLFDEKHKVTFNTFASSWIRSHVNGEAEKKARWSREIPASLLTTRSNVHGGRPMNPLDNLVSAEADPFDDADGIYPLSARFMRHLTKTEKIVIRRRYGIDSGYTETLEEIAKSLKLTKERIRQIQKKAIIKIRLREGIDHAE